MIGVLAAHPRGALSADGEQGLQVLALAAAGEEHLITVEEVAIFSPFPPHRRTLGSCGAHFVGLNARSLGWSLDGRPADQYTRGLWAATRPRIEEQHAALRRPKPAA